MAEAHDATRHLLSGAPTFDRIMGNLRSIHTSMFVNVRNNLHADSLDSFDELCKAVDAIARENGTNIRCSPTTMHRNEASRARGDTTRMITESQYEQILAHTDLPTKLKSFTPQPIPCMVTLANEMHIDDLGYVYPHCSTYAVDPTRAVGNLLDEDEGGTGRLGLAARRRHARVSFPRRPAEMPRLQALAMLLGRMSHGPHADWRATMPVEPLRPRRLCPKMPVGAG